LIKRIIIWWFKKKGWVFQGPLPKKLRKMVIIAAPHTDKLDFVYGMALVYIIGFKTDVLVRRKYFRGLKGLFMRNLEAVPFEFGDQNDRSALLEKFKTRTHYSCVFANRNLGEDPSVFHEDFYDMAMQVGVPVVMVAIDYRRKQVKVHHDFIPSGDRKRDIRFVRNYFAYFHGYDESITVPRVDY
jgi:1-acyl-sn-glycerol-3-phosphate acyltransferase